MWSASSSPLLKISLEKCCHRNQPKKRIGSVDVNQSVSDLFHEEHESVALVFKAWSDIKGWGRTDLGHHLLLGDIMAKFTDVDNISFKCLDRDILTENIDDGNDESSSSSGAKTPKRSAFDLLMNRKREFVQEKTTEKLNRKDELFNDIARLFKDKGADFCTGLASVEGSYCVQVVTNALWYVTNDHMTINDAAQHSKGVDPIPKMFNQYVGYNDIKRKKLKSLPLSADTLNSHAQALYSLLLKPCAKSTTKWRELALDIKSLADCLNGYRDYLGKKKLANEASRNSLTPAKSIDQNATVEHHEPCQSVDEKYKRIETCVLEAGMNKPVIVIEQEHTPFFSTSKERLRFYENLHLSVPIDLFTFCPGGSRTSVFAVVEVAENRSINEMMTDGARMLQTLRPHFKEVHTRAQKNEFKTRVSNIACIQPSLLEVIYQELALDSSVANHPTTAQRIRAMFLGAEGLVADLRHLNPGRPGNNFDPFFEQMKNVIEESLVAADDRRHGASHMSQWVSLKDLIKKTEVKCPEGTAIPSKDLVRLQFIPKNPYTKTALNFTSKLQIQHKIQRRQLRAHHEDDHYCAALFKYIRSKAVEEREHVMLFCCDDKAKVHVGEPDAPISTGVRGRKTITPASNTLEALDHDMHKASLTPNVVLRCEIPSSVDKSFVRGNVYFTVSDSVFQSSSPFRHGVMLAKIAKNFENIPPVLMKYTDGGTDQRNTLEAVKVASICLFKELNLDFLVAARCAPGHSFMNPAERIMSILNLGLQNVATERSPDKNPDIEKKFKRCGSMKELRELVDKDKDLKKAWLESVAEVQSLIGERFNWLSLKEEPFQKVDVVKESEIKEFQQHALKLFPTMNMNKLTKCDVRNIDTYHSWKKQHCKEEHYALQIKKCSNVDCCSPSKLPMEELKWLPMPILDSTGEHYIPYTEAKETKDASERDRPSLKVKKAKKGTPSAKQASANAPSTEVSSSGSSAVASSPSISMSAQNARAVIVCVECEKPRVIYAKTKLNVRQQLLLAKTMSEYEYSCGAYLFPPTEKSKTAESMTIRPNLQCAMQIEVPYYSSNVGRKDRCSHCSASGCKVNTELKKKYQTVLPICQNCVKEQKEPFTARPFGKAAKK